MGDLRVEIFYRRRQIAGQHFAGVVIHRQQRNTLSIQLAAKLADTTVTIKTKVGEGGKLFGAITSKQIADLLAEQKLEVDRRKIVLPEPIKMIGKSLVEIKIHPEVIANGEVNIVEE